MEQYKNVQFYQANICFNNDVFGSISSVNPIECVPMSNQECKVRSEIVNVNSNEPLFYPFSIKTKKCSGSCNNVNNPYEQLCVSDVVKNLNIKVSI